MERGHSVQNLKGGPTELFRSTMRALQIRGGNNELFKDVEFPSLKSGKMHCTTEKISPQKEHQTQNEGKRGKKQIKKKVFFSVWRVAGQAKAGRGSACQGHKRAGTGARAQTRA